MTMKMFYSLSLGSSVKLVIIILFILLTLYLLELEYRIMRKSEFPKISMSAPHLSSKTVRDLLLLGIPAAGSYFSMYKAWKDTSTEREQRDLFQRHLAETKRIADLTEVLTQRMEGLEANKMASVTQPSMLEDAMRSFRSLVGLSKTTTTPYISLVERAHILTRDLQTINSLKNKQTPLTSSEQVLVSKEDIIVKELGNITTHMAKVRESVAASVDKVNKDLDSPVTVINPSSGSSSYLPINSSSFSITSFYSKFEDYINSLSLFEMMCAVNLVMNYLALNYTIHIIFIMYGDYLIIRFKLETKYPRLAKWIKFRRTLQSYYLKICFGMLIFSILPQIIFNISILYPTLVHLFF